MSRKHGKKISLPPVEAYIHGLSHEGRGIATIEGKTTFVSNALPGEKVVMEYSRKKGKFDEAKAIEILHASPERVAAPCSFFGVCGGCALQHMSLKAQIAHKEAVLKEQLHHFGQVQPQQWLAPVADQSLGYRRKARLGVRYVAKKESVLVGFREKEGRFLTDMDRCEVLHPQVGDNIAALRALLLRLEAKDTIAQMEIAVDDERVAVILRHLKPLSSADLQQLEAFMAEKNWWLYLQSKGPDTIFLYYPKLDKASLSYSLKEYGLTLYFQPQDFTQVNQGINEKMLALALDLLALEPEDEVLDLFCGLGNFTLPLATKAAFVTGVEGDEAMTARALGNAQLNQLSNVRFFAANLFEPPLHEQWMQQRYDKILLDPPRAGAEAMMHHLPALAAKKIVYVSCNPATMARDIGILVNQYGYKLQRAGIMDMFPHTAHVESIALLEK